jgi:signal transduction histidine kinase
MPYRRITDTARLQALLGAVLLIESDLELTALLHRIVEAACDLAGARYGALGVLDPKERRIAQFITVGLSEEEITAIGPFPTGRGILGLLMDDAQPIRISELSRHPQAIGFPPNHPPMHSFLGAPVRVRDEVFGNLYLTEKIDGAEFSEIDLDVIDTLATAAGLAISNARLNETVQELSVAADRDRIARDLHDTVIQRLYGIGLALQGSLRLAEDETLRSRIQGSIDDLDRTILQVRTTIFELEDRAPTEQGLRAQVIAVVTDAGRGFGFEPEVRFVGPLDSAVSDELGSHVIAVLREALSNIARHAQASRVEIQLNVDDERVRLSIADNGLGFDASAASIGNGVRNMGHRAEMLGGSCLVGVRIGGGTEVQWNVPV